MATTDPTIRSTPPAKDLRRNPDTRVWDAYALVEGHAVYLGSHRHSWQAEMLYEEFVQNQQLQARMGNTHLSIDQRDGTLTLRSYSNAAPIRLAPEQTLALYSFLQEPHVTAKLLQATCYRPDTVPASVQAERMVCYDKCDERCGQELGTTLICGAGADAVEAYIDDNPRAPVELMLLHYEPVPVERVERALPHLLALLRHPLLLRACGR